MNKVAAPLRNIRILGLVQVALEMGNEQRAWASRGRGLSMAVL